MLELFKTACIVGGIGIATMLLSIFIFSLHPEYSFAPLLGIPIAICSYITLFMGMFYFLQIPLRALGIPADTSEGILIVITICAAVIGILYVGFHLFILVVLLGTVISIANSQ